MTKLGIEGMPVAARRFTKPRQSVSLSEQAYLILRDRILKGQLPLGAPISRRKLAAELGMSLIPVAEALQRLENDELVESRPRVGTRVCLPTPEDIRDRYVVREALESQAARLFAENATVAQKLEMQTMAENMDAMFNRFFAAPTDDSEFLYAVHAYHTQFHFRLAEYAGCRVLRQAIEKNHVLILNWLYDVAAHRPPLPPRHHRDLMEALAKNDPDEADKAMRYHVRFGLGQILNALGSPQN
jgi:DNA-binding GntR family transcriptional regulator